MKRFLVITLIVVSAVQCRKETTPATPINSLNVSSTGKSAHDLLSSDTYSSLAIEIQYMPGMQLLPESLNNLTSFLNTYLNKPGGITITQKQIGSFSADTVSLRQVADFETQNRATYTNGNVIAVYILLSDANYGTSPNVLGIAYLNTSIVLFEKSIIAHSGGFGEASRLKVESSVLEHEFGHLLGLVNLGTPMVTPHEDEAHQHHCNNAKCLMYYETETFGFTNRVENIVPSFDANCLDDLKANGGK